MLFNSATFIFFYVPTVLIGFYWFGRRAMVRAALCWLLLASVVFYGWWNPRYVLLLGISLAVNYMIGAFITPARGLPLRKVLLVLGLCFNVGLLGYFKYAGFLVDTVSALAGLDFTVRNIVLPLAISFYTFQQIAYLVDTYQGKVLESNFVDYSLFVLFFPQLIAGPIVHHSELMPQFADPQTFKFDPSRLSIGISIFAMGLFKKVILADSMTELTRGIYRNAESGIPIQFLEAWAATLGYTCQIYFDFSGYSDMAIGLGCMFGIRLPLNFRSPLRSSSFIELWSNWHMTLTRFLRDYIFLPLNRSGMGPVRRNVNLLIVMLVAGLWHGANWTFVAWGAVLGGCLIINHLWRALLRGHTPDGVLLYFYRFLTFFAFVISVVFFRSESFISVNNMLFAMFGGNGFSLPEWSATVPGYAALAALAGGKYVAMDFVTPGIILTIVALICVLWVWPNTQQIMRHYLWREYRINEPKNFTRAIVWQPTALWAIIVGMALFVSVISLWETSEFIYYQF